MDKKIDFAVRLIQAAANMAEQHGQPLEIAYSGGKDSDCILELAKMAGINYRAIYKNTTIDPPHTIAHCKSKGVEIMQPKMRFAEVMRKCGMPSRHYRVCCDYLKEYKILDYVVIGVRRSESTKRAKRYHEPEQCRVYKGGQRERQYFPLLEWSDQDVKQFIEMRGIKCHPLYYDKLGFFHVERRLGCLACPLQSKAKRIEEFQKYPRMVNFYINNMLEFMRTHPNNALKRNFGSAYAALCRELFYDSNEKFKYARDNNLFGEEVNYKSFLENFFNITL